MITDAFLKKCLEAPISDHYKEFINDRNKYLKDLIFPMMDEHGIDVLVGGESSLLQSDLPETNLKDLIEGK